MKETFMCCIKTPLCLCFTFIVALMFLDGCTVGPDYVRPVATPVMPTSYKEVNGWKTAQPMDSVVKGTWWRIFDDPQLNALEEQVVVSNQNILEAEANFLQARSAIQAARSGYYPSVGAGTSVSRSRQSADISASSKTASYYTLPVDTAWELDIWGRVRRNVEASRADAQASEADLAALRLSIQAQLAQTYFELRTLDAQKELLDATVSSYQRSLDLTMNRYSSGVVSRSDVLQAETQLKSTMAQTIDLGVQRARLEHAIALLIGKPASVFSLSPAPLAVMPPSIPLGVPSELLERRPDIAAAERRMAADNARIGVSEAAWYPSITLSASGGFQATSLSKWLGWPSLFWSMGPSVSEALFDGGLRKAQTAQARAAYDAGVAAYRQIVLTGFQEVEDNLAALRIWEEEARVQDEAVQAARQAVSVAENQYQAGITSYLTVLTAQAAEFGNEKTAIAIRGNRMTAAVLLVKALGGGWDSLTLNED